GCGRRSVVDYRRATARITRCRRTEHRCRRAFHRAFTALTTNARSGRVYYVDGLTHCAAGVPAIVYRVPALGRRVLVPAGPSCGRRPVVYHRRATARITRCRRTEHRCRRAFHRAFTALTTNARSGRIYYMDGLTHCAAGVPAIVDRVPALGRRVCVPARPSCGRRPVVYHCRATARITSCRRTEHRCGRAFHCAFATLTANRWC